MRIHILMCSFLVACAVDDGLAIDQQSTDHVAGTYHSLAFDFASTHDTRTLALHAPDGHAIVTSTIADGVETVDVHDGKLVMSGAINALEPLVAGDMAELAAASDEAKVLPELRDALVAAGVDAELVSPARAVPDLYFNTSDGLWHLSPWDQKSFATWGLWYPTNVYVRNFGSNNEWFYYATTFGNSVSHYLSPSAAGQYVVYGWGSILTVYNFGGWASWSWGITGPNEIGVTTW